MANHETELLSEIKTLRTALARSVTARVMESDRQGFVQMVADLTLIPPNDDQDAADYWKFLLETLVTGAQRILNRTALRTRAAPTSEEGE